MPLQCHTCNERRLVYIDRQILSGRPLLSIAKELQISYPSLRGHVAHGHHHPSWDPARSVRPDLAYLAQPPVDDEDAWRAELDLGAYDRLAAGVAAPAEGKGEGAFARWAASLPSDQRAWMEWAVALDVEPVDLMIAVKYDVPLAEVVAHFAEGHHQH